MRGKGINIELTALLDVILILLFVILIQSGSQVQMARENAEGQENRAASLEGDLAVLQDKMSALEMRNQDLERYKLSEDLVQDNSFLLMISIQELEDQAIVVEGENLPPVRIPLEEDRLYVSNLLRSTLDKQLRESLEPAVFIVFSYDSRAIYQSDYTLIRDAMLEKRYDPNVYLIEQDIKGR